ncbi:uncharacterized protein LOC141656766 isoform X3 [Silene latifolia]|uniref:uncharacterized protein LOC141656766 isoform X3 n=1 Tax=Silene latifolia TaxID=37657 RepID=UPI003D78656F
MEATAASAARGVSMSQSSSPSRKQWRVVSEHPARNAGNEEVDRSRLGQSDERTIYEQGQELRDVMEFHSIQMDGIVSVDDGIVQQRIQNLARQREEMQQVEIELRAQLIAKAEIVEMQNTFEAQFKEQSSTMSRLQVEQLREKEQSIHELERKMEEKERELHAVRLDNEAAWAKEDLLREQSNEIANYRREHDSIEAERAHHRQQIHELQEHIQEKERQMLELQDQHRVAQETILYKDEQIREAQAWMGRVQEIDVLQSSTLQAELRERTEQFNQLWLGSQRQFAEMERMHMQAIQQYQLELAAVRGNTGVYNGESSMSQNVSSDGSQIAQNNGNLVEANGGGTPNGNSGGLANGNTEYGQQYASSGNSSSQTNHTPSLPITPSIIGIPSYLPPGQVSAMHPYVMHQQGAGQAVGSHIPQSHVGHFHSVPAMTSFHQWQNQQAPSEGLTKSSADQFSLSQAEENSSRSGFNYSYGFSINERTLQQDYLSNSMSQRVDPSSQISSTEEAQTLESVERSYFVDAEAQHNLQQISSQFHEALRLEPLNNTTDMKAHENEVGSIAANEPVSQDVMTEQPSSTASPSPLESSVQPVHVNEASLNCASDAVLSTEQTNSLASGTVPESALLDERALLASIVRTIPPGGKIRISSTLPNRLGKMLAPLRWHDYKKIYGKLDDFVASHPELFVIEGDYIQLREGAQGIIAATAAVAKVAAAAAAASSPYLSFFPPVAVTPMADFGRVKKMPSTESKPVRNVMSSSHPSTMQTQYSNGSAFNVTGNLSNVKILSKPKDPMEFNGQPLRVHAENGTHSDRSGLGNPQSKVPVHSRPVANFNGKQPGSHRTATALPSRR